MLNKSLAFGLVATAMLVAPTAAIAGDQEQYNNQRAYQNGAAVDGSTNVQKSESRNYQQQIQRNRRERDGYGDGYYYREHDGYGDGYYRRHRDRDDYYHRDRDRDDYYYDH